MEDDVGLLAGIISCSCKWKNGKQTVNCDGKGLSDIPDGLDPGTQVLDFSGNFMNNLPDELFSNKQLINLQRIYLSNCQIKIINEKTFKGLTNLVELDLSSNSLEVVPTSSFVDCPSLMRLTLSSNPLKILKKLAFNHLSFLNTLELSNCKLYEIEEGAFQGLHSLEWLLLDENSLKTIRGSDTLPQNLKGVELRGNPWECDCHIKDLHVWLKNFNVPISEEPTCRGPSRLANRVVKSIPAPELACLPDVSPTTFYLELAEGKNVSLQCHVHSVPEASVSWWFRGQILQNNTIVAPGIHLIYFVEEGAENKRSELFIYNANSEDNGTFICNAENAAGTSQSNFTIKIIIKEDPIVIIVSFPFEYLLAVVIGAVALGLVIISVITVSILRCRRRCRRQATKTKDVALHYQQTLKREEVAEPDPLKADPDEEMALYGAHPRDDRPVVPADQLGSPASLRYQLEQNPDLINGMECRREEPCLHPGCTMDVRWVDAEGYPVDYGLPKVPDQSAGYYRTLPSGRIRRQPPNARTRYSQEPEFLARAFDHYHADVRYTADGYPAPSSDVAPSSLPCCSVQWPTCVPASLHVVDGFYDPSALAGGIIKRCVGAQTEDGEQRKIDPNAISSRNEAANETLTESPDEGYEGEPSVV
ncbi:LRR 8 and/or Ig 2 domain containing protein [Asbolus verrucosus]|uniref:LRR 8 and/or Ig 2 domain containing protein n=1 Tax=Asbolus verrucosus TaxID=1661398 RepID=A0A482VC50_ASBVE|nr:LRR 8 and/or Ig 2 domain containing protein [Asbolus verrucosus]